MAAEVVNGEEKGVDGCSAAMVACLRLTQVAQMEEQIPSAAACVQSNYC